MILALFFLYLNKPAKHTGKILTVGTAAEFPPFEYQEGSDIVGFDIDLINEIAKRLSKQAQFHDFQFSALIPHLQAGTIDLVAAGLTPTPERAQQVIFSDLYLEGSPLVVVMPAQNGTLQSLDDLAGKTVIVNEGFSADLYMSEIKNITIKRLATVADAFLTLAAGNADAFVTAATTLIPFFEQHDRSQFSLFEIPGTKEPAAFAINPKKAQLAQEINAAIKQLKEDGTLEILKRKWQL